MGSMQKSRLIDIPGNASFYIAENKHLRADVFPLHYHHVNELFYILDGRGEVILNDVRTPVKKTDLILIRSNEDHAFIDDQRDLLHLYCIYFSDDIVNYQQADNPLVQFVHGLPMNERIISTHDNPDFYDIPRYFRRILFEQNNQTEESQLLMRLIFTEMLIRIKRFINFDKSQWLQATSSLSPTERSVLSVIRYMEKNYYRNLLLEELAIMVPLGPRQFIRIFRKLTNKHFKEFIQELRINEAKRLLSTRQKEIKSVCFEVGFEDLSHFYRVFRKFTGTTPKNYVTSLQEQGEMEGA